MAIRKAAPFICYFLFAVYAFAEETQSADSRKEIWIKERQEKAKSIEPEESSTLQKALLRIEQKGLIVRYKGFYPGVANFPTGAGFAPQVRRWDPYILGDAIDLQTLAAYSTRGYQKYIVQIGRILQLGPEPLVGEGGSGGLSKFRGLRKKPSDFYLYGEAAYRNFPQEDFFGIGPDSNEDDRTDFRLETFSIDGVAGYRINPWFVVAGRAGYMSVNEGRGTDSRFPDTEDLFDDTTAPGLATQPDFVNLSGLAFVDYREKPGNPHTGGFYGFRFNRLIDQEDGTFSFNRYTFDARQYFSLGSVQRVLALHLLTSMDKADEGSRVPFYAMETLGGSEFLRGFREFRFRDENVLLMQAEYRWEAAPAWELALFYDTGKVFPDGADWNFDDLEDSYGFGVRFKTSQAVFMRFDIARSNEGTRFYWKFSSVF